MSNTNAIRALVSVIGNESEHFMETSVEYGMVMKNHIYVVAMHGLLELKGKVLVGGVVCSTKAELNKAIKAKVTEALNAEEDWNK